MAALTIAQRDAWLLAGAALAAGRDAEARVSAQRAVDLSGWSRYRLAGSINGVQLRSCDLVPRGWGFFQRRGSWDQLVLVHPDAVDFFTETVGHRTLMARIRDFGTCLFEVDVALSVLLTGALEAPDHL